MSPKATEDPSARISVCECVSVFVCVCECVPYTKPGQHSCSTFSFQKVSLRGHSLLSLLNPGWMLHISVPVCVCSFVDMSIISFIHKVYEASLLPHFQETPHVRDFSPTSFFQCAFQYHVQSKQIESEGDPSNIQQSG
ncbi:uncharacterized [Lates japonicus]